MYGNQITKIEGLDKLENLTTLSLYSNQITNIDGVSNLKKLTTLNLYRNQITNIDGVSNLKNLTTLDLSNNQIEDILPLAECNQLTSLNLKGNANIKVEGYTEEETQKLLEIGKIMTERNGTINVDIEKLSLFNGYTNLDLSNQNLTDLTLLKGQTELTVLNLSGNQITLADIESQEILKKMTKLKTLNLVNNNLTDISAINSLTSLTYLDISGNNVNLQQIEDIISSIQLHVGQNQETINSLKNCTPSKITNLNFAYGVNGCELPDLSRFTSLEELNLTKCNVSSGWDRISKVKSLKTLNITACNLHNKGMIDFTNLTNLTYLNLTTNDLWTEDLENLKALKNNKNLTIVLSYNVIIDANALLELDPSCKIYLGGNVNLSQESKTALTARFGKNVIF